MGMDMHKRQPGMFTDCTNTRVNYTGNTNKSTMNSKGQASSPVQLDKILSKSTQVGRDLESMMLENKELRKLNVVQ